jgi:methylenetetrahydrofolate dehydrogenase (NAD+)
MSSDFSGKGLLMKADPIAAVFQEEVKSTLALRPQRHRLVGILSTSSEPSHMYAEFTKKQCNALGVDFVLKKTGAAESKELNEGDGVEEAIMEANEDDQVDGIMVGDILFSMLWVTNLDDISM